MPRQNPEAEYRPFQPAQGYQYRPPQQPKPTGVRSGDTGNGQINSTLVYQITPLGRALDDAISEMGLEGELVTQIKDQYKKAIEKEFEELNSNNNHRHQSSKFKLNGDCGSYNNLFYVWEFKDVKFELPMDDGQVTAENCRLITIPHKDFKMNTKPDDHGKKKKKNKK